MWICKKCSKQVSDGSKICRDCGAILEEMPDILAPGTTVERETGSPWRTPPAPGSSEVASDKAERQSARGFAPKPAESVPSDYDLPDWKCPQCGETVPGTFDVCWKCLASRGDEQAEQIKPVLGDEALDDDTPAEQPEPTERLRRDSATENDERSRPGTGCPQCGSAQMMFGVKISDQGQGSRGKLCVVVYGKPSALIFKDALFGELRADICGDCGHVELRVADPQALYKRYRTSRLK